MKHNLDDRIHIRMPKELKKKLKAQSKKLGYSKVSKHVLNILNSYEDMLHALWDARNNLPEQSELIQRAIDKAEGR